MARAGKTYFITGGASGLGEATARLLHAQGANVVIADKNAKLGRALHESLGDRALFVEVDVIDRGSVQAAMDKTVEVFGGVNGIVNCAGTGAAATTISRKLEPMSANVWDFIMKLNVYGTFNVSAIGAAAMAKHQPSSPSPDTNAAVIVNVASVAGIEGQKGQVAYSASKGAVIGMTLPMARDLSRYGIRVVTIAPGIMDTPLMKMAAPKVREGLLASVAGPKRFGKAEEFAALVAACIDNGYLNGEVIRLDGGIRFANM